MDMSKCNIGTHGFPDYIGAHEPAIVHRTGGPSAELKNVCGKCGRFICKVDAVWVVDEARESE